MRCDRRCCSLGMTGPRTITTLRSKTSRVGGSPGAGSRRAWRGSRRCTRWWRTTCRTTPRPTRCWSGSRPTAAPLSAHRPAARTPAWPTGRRCSPIRDCVDDYATARLSDADIEALGSELDRIRADVVASRGERDASYIHTVIKVQRGREVGGRTLLLGSLLPPLWLAGTAMLSAAKILENMEIGHNVLHGQWDWMRDPEIHSTTWEWDLVTPAAAWKHTHNDLHHTWTNVVGRDRDIGYTIIRMSEDQAWRPWHLAQPAYNLLLAAVFEWGIALFDLELDDVVHGRKSKRELFDQVRAVLGKAIRQAAKDYVLFPLLSGPSAVPTLVANLTANVVRNVWAHTTIFCGHFPDGVEQFTVAEVDGELLDAVREVPA